jgi:porin
MISKNKKTWLSSLLILAALNGMAQDEVVKKESPFTFNASYIGDVVSNFSGGIKTGTNYLGLANIKGGFDTEKANWWKGGSFFVNVGNTHGDEPSANLVGDFQGVSNIEAGNLTFMYELWYKQKINKVEVTLGLQDLNASYAVCDDGALFENSSFGIQSSIADNIPAPIFPLTALGANIQWDISDAFQWRSAIFDGTPDDFEKNPYNTHWRLSKNDGFLSVSELQVNKSLIKGKQGTYKLGVYYHQHNDTATDEERQNGGLYFVADQQLTGKISVFSQIGLSPKSKNENNRYFSVGFNCKKPFAKRPNDMWGVALAYAGIDKNTVGSETTLEVTYQLQLNDNIYIKPDLQYVMTPAGTEEKLSNALVGTLRFGINF